MSGRGSLGLWVLVAAGWLALGFSVAMKYRLWWLQTEIDNESIGWLLKYQKELIEGNRPHHPPGVMFDLRFSGEKWGIGIPRLIITIPPGGHL